MAEVGSAFVTIAPSMRGFGSKLNAGVGGEVDTAGKKAGLSFGKVFGAVAALGIGAKVGSFLKDSIAEAREAQVVGARTESVIKSMGLAGSVSAGQIGKLATSLSNKTAIDDEAIQSGQNLLLTFGNVAKSAGESNGVFAQTSGLMVDLSAAMGQDMKSSAVQLGKALNDPVKGVSALSRVGVSFTEQQKEQIKTLVDSGNTMKAQKVILGELEKQFGGAAASMATPAEKAKVAFGNLKEQIGTAFLPIIDRVATTLSQTVVPAVSSFIAGMQSGTGVGGVVAGVFKTVAGVLADVGRFLKENAAIIVPFVVGVAAGAAVFKVIAVATKVWTAAQAALNLVMSANPIGIVIAVVAGLVAAFVVAYKKSETFRNIVDGAFNAVKNVITTVINAVKNVITNGWDKIKSTFSTAVDAVKNLVSNGWDRIKEIFSKAVEGWKIIIGNAVDRVKEILGKAIEGWKIILSNAWEAIKNGVSRAWDGIKNAVTDGAGKVLDFVRELPGKIKNALGSLTSTLYDAGRDLIQGMINGVRDMASNIAKAAGDVVGSAIDAAKRKLGINSPSRVFLEIGHQTGEGLRLGLADMQGPVQRQMSRLALPNASLVARPSVSADSMAGPASMADLVTEMRRQSAILERMPRDYRMGARQGA